MNVPLHVTQLWHGDISLSRRWCSTDRADRAPRNIGDFFLSLGKDAGDLLRVDLEMFKEGLRKMGVIMAPQDVEKVFAACDRNGDGQLDVEEFAANFVKHGQTKERRLLAMSDVAHHAPGPSTHQHTRLKHVMPLHI